MKHTKRFLTIIVLGCLALGARSQTLESGYFLDGNLQRSMLNPAFQGEHNYLAFPALSNVMVGVDGNFGLSNFLFPYNRDGYALTTFMSGTVDADRFIKGLPKSLRLGQEFDMTLIAAGFRGWGGYNTIRLSTRQQMGIRIPRGLFEFAKCGFKNERYDFSGFALSANAYADLALGHSRKIDDNLTVGATAHFLFGLFDADVSLDALTLEMNEEHWLAESQYSGHLATCVGFNTNFGDITRPEELLQPASSFGFGVDLGATYDLDDVVEGLEVSASLTDFGLIGWSMANGMTSDRHRFEYTGFRNIDYNNLDVEGQTEQIRDDLKELYEGDFSDRTGKFRTMLSPTIRLGAEYAMPFYDKLSAGLLIDKRFGKWYPYTDARLFANIAPVKILEGSLNFGFSTFGTQLGWMLNFHPKGFAFFVGSDCVVMRRTPQGVPVDNLNFNLAFGVNIPF